MRSNLYIIFSTGILALTACSTSRTTSTIPGTEESSLLNKKWQLVELDGKPVASKINNKEAFVQFEKNDEGYRYTASGGCNGMGGSYTLTAPGRIRFSQGMSTMMACEDMTAESGLRKVFDAADNFTVSGGVLSLNKARMAPLARFKVIDPDAAHELDGSWELEYISGPRITFEGLYPDKKPFITINTSELKANGNSSCNNYHLTFVLKGINDISFGNVASTKMACEGAGEATFFDMLKRVNRYSVNDATLTFIADDIAVMRLKKK